MIIRVDSVPLLIPCHRVNGWLFEKAPPVNMREIWIGRTLVAAFLTPGYFDNAPGARAKVIDLVKTPYGWRSASSPTTQSSNDQNGRAKFLVKFKEGLLTVASMDVSVFIIEWYRKKWPHECDFVFRESEAIILGE
jgi:hypothetical protein